jgi:hypothetical protein
MTVRPLICGFVEEVVGPTLKSTIDVLQHLGQVLELTQKIETVTPRN